MEQKTTRVVNREEEAKSTRGWTINIAKDKVQGRKQEGEFSQKTGGGGKIGFPTARPETKPSEKQGTKWHSQKTSEEAP